MNPGTFVTLLILSWLLLAGVTLWALLRVPMRRARLQKLRAEADAHAALSNEASNPGMREQPATKRRLGSLLWGKWRERPQAHAR